MENVVRIRSALVVVSLVALVVGPTSVDAAPAQATWTVSASSCPWGGQVKVMAQRSGLSQNPASSIMCNLTGNRDSDLRSAGTDNFSDGYKVGNYSTSNANTHTLGNYMGFTLIVYNGLCYSGGVYTLPSGQAMLINNSSYLYGLLSMKATTSPAC